MHSFHSLWFAAAATVAGCASVDTVATTPDLADSGVVDVPAAISDLRIVATMRGKGDAQLRVTAIPAGAHAVGIEQALDVRALSSSVVDLPVPTTRYAIRVDVVDATARVLGSVSKTVTLAPGAATEIRVSGTLDGDSAVELALVVDTAPVLEDLEVGTRADSTGATLVVHVGAYEPDARAMTYFWSGFASDDVIVGAATLDLTAATALSLHDPGVVRLTVVDATGATTSARIHIGADALATLRSGSASPTPNGASALEAAPANVSCLATYAQCEASCDTAFGPVTKTTSPHDVCVTECAVGLAKCG